jgi:hypothetical protein
MQVSSQRLFSLVVLLVVSLAVSLVPAVPAAAQKPPARPTSKPADQDKPAPKPRRSAPTTAAPAPAPVLLISADMGCRIELDGEPLGDLEPNIVREFRLRPGEHLLQAFPHEVEGPVWKDTVKAPETGKVVTTIELRKLVEQWSKDRENVNRFEVEGAIVADRETGLLWTRTATPEMKWSEIAAYCAKLRVDGLAGWRVPNLDEASKLYWPDHPSPRQETTRPGGEWTIFGKKKGEMQVLPRNIFEPFDQSSVGAIWVTGAEERIACSFLGPFSCTVEGRKAQASTFCVRSGAR